MVFLHALQGILSLQIIVSVAYVLARKGWFSPETQILLPRLVTTVALPSYLFYTITHSFGRDDLVHLLYGSLFPLLSILLTFGVAWLIATIARVERRHFGLFCTSFSTSNTVFIGLPVNLALFGDAAAPYVLLYFFANTSFFWSIGSYLISHDNEELRGSATLLDNVRHIFSPPMLGFLAGLAMTLLGLGLPGFVQEALRYMGNLTTPLALIFIGICLYKMDLRHLHLSRDLVLALLGKLVLCPLILAVMLHFVELPEQRTSRGIVERLSRPVEKPVEYNHQANRRNPARDEYTQAENAEPDNDHIFALEEIACEARKRCAYTVSKRKYSGDNPHFRGVHPERILNLRQNCVVNLPRPLMEEKRHPEEEQQKPFVVVFRSVVVVCRHI